MLATKLTSIAFIALLLFPVARTFYEMWRFEAPKEFKADDREPVVPKVPDETLYGISITQFHYAVSPFTKFNRFLAFGPRRWVGIVGLITTAFVFLLLAFSALFLVRGETQTHELRHEPVEEVIPDPDDIIHWDEFDLPK